MVGAALSELTHVDERISQYDKYIAKAAAVDEQSGQLMRLSGIGPTTASAIVAPARVTTSPVTANSVPGWVWCQGSTAQEANSAWGASPRRETLICAPC